MDGDGRIGLSWEALHKAAQIHISYRAGMEQSYSTDAVGAVPGIKGQSCPHCKETSSSHNSCTGCGVDCIGPAASKCRNLVWI